MNPKDKSLSILIKEADDLFSEVVRRESMDEHGFITCFVTGVRIPWKQSDAAHFINRQHMNTRYERMNVHATSIQSNRFDNDHKKEYHQRMLETYGLHRVNSLERRGNSLQKYTRIDLIDLISAWKLELKELRKQKL